MEKFVFVDIDGTLFDHESGIPDSAVKAIQTARKNGHKIFICTGRPGNELEQDITSIGFDGYITSSGAYVKTDETVLFYQPMAPLLIEELRLMLDKYHIGYNLEGIETSYLNEGGTAFFEDIFTKELNGNSELARHHMHKCGMRPVSELDTAGKGQILKISIFSKHEEHCLALKNELSDKVEITLHRFHNSAVINGELSTKGITKATGIDIILDYYKASLPQTIALGDSMNDASMIQHCAAGICMGNGADDLKAISDYVCEPLKEDGLYKAFQKMGLI